MNDVFHADVAVIGSGFGGAASALRLAEKGHRVVVLEQGRRHSRDDLQAARKDPRRYLYLPEVGLKGGFFWQRVFRDVAIIGASGVGGGSIVWAAVLLEPGTGFFTDPGWSHLCDDWQAELAPHYERAATMLGRTMCPTSGPMDDHLRAAARTVGAEQTYGPVPVAIYFGEEGRTVADPFFDGEGPERTGCKLCGGCLVGCPHGSKNTLDLNYLHLAENLGAQIRPEQRVNALKPLPGGGYEVGIDGADPLRARAVVVSAGVLGSLELLFRCRDDLGTLLNISGRLGQQVRTNSEAVTAILDGDPDADLSRGPTISSDFHPDEHTHITQNRYMGGWHMRFQLGPLVDGHDPPRRALATLKSIVAHPVRHARMVGARNFERRLTALTVMQDHDNQVGFRFAPSPVRPWRKVLRSDTSGGEKAPSYLPVANEVTRAFADASGGTAHNLLIESVGGRSMTAHILGGACMGADADDGVIDTDHQVFGHPGLYVMDASAIPANLGVNPSLTITAMAERFASRFPDPTTLRSGTEPAPADDDEHLDTGPRPVAPTALSELVQLYRRLACMSIGDLEGTWRAEIAGPAPLARAAAPALGVAGLADWFGKRFTAADSHGISAGTNLLGGPARPEDLAETLPMRATIQRSWVDGFATVAVSYHPSERLPWRRVRDELRPIDEHTLVGVSLIDAPGLRRRAVPFLLHRVGSRSADVTTTADGLAFAAP